MSKTLRVVAIHNTQSDYPIYIGVDVLAQLPDFIRQLKPSFILVLCDVTTVESCLPLLQPHLVNKVGIPIHSYTLETGEQQKNLDTCSKILAYLLEQQADRNTLIINLGGGMVSDIGGMVAGLYKRGVFYLNIPTTLLAQVDASIGGKVGVNFGETKNQVGLFNSPEAVFIDLRTLNTLPMSAFLSGFAEVLKHGLIADKTYWQQCSQIAINNLTSAQLSDIIFHSCEIKKGIVEEDPYEVDMRKWLNFGHTVGHALESALLGSLDVLSHGEAVAIGMLIEAKISYQLGMLSEKEFLEIEEVILNFRYLKKVLSVPHDPFVNALYADKKNQNRELKFTLLQAIGKAKENITVSLQQVGNALAPYINIV